MVGQYGFGLGADEEGLVSLIAGSNCAAACPFGLPATTEGDIYTVAGGGSSSPGDGGPATSADLVYPDALALNGVDGLLIGEGLTTSSVGSVQLVPTAGCSTGCLFGLPSMVASDIYTIAGGGATFPGDGGPGTSAEVSAEGVAFDSSGDALVADNFNGRLRLVARSNCASSCPFALGSITSGDIYTLAAGQVHPSGLSLDSAGDLLVADSYDNDLRLIAASNCLSSCPFGLRSTTAGGIYTIAGNGDPG